MKEAPQLGDYSKWISIFEKEIGKVQDLGFCALTFDKDGQEEYELSEFSC